MEIQQREATAVAGRAKGWLEKKSAKHIDG